MWKKFKGRKPEGVLIPGDPTAPPTTWWNHLWLALFGWKLTTVFSLPQMPGEGYHIGYIPDDGQPVYNTSRLMSPSFRVRNGREECVFFAVDRDGNEVPLKFKAQADRDEPQFKNIALL